MDNFLTRCEAAVHTLNCQGTIAHKQMSHLPMLTYLFFFFLKLCDHIKESAGAFSTLEEKYNVSNVLHQLEHRRRKRNLDGCVCL